MKKLKFVAGGSESSRQFVANAAEVYKDEVISDETISVLPAGKLIFRQGDAGTKSTNQSVSERAKQKEGNKILPLKNETQSRGELAREIYIDMLLLRAFYGRLAGLSQENSELFEEMQGELAIVSVAMLKIHQNISRTRGEINQNNEVSSFSTFCSGLNKTANLQRKILFDLRTLQRSTDGQNLLAQLTIIYLTIQSQHETILELSQSEC